jgi:hypothetical protein
MLPHAIGAEGRPCEVLIVFDLDARRATSPTKVPDQRSCYR